MNNPALQRKNIDLPVEVLRKLSIMAAAKGESVKAFIEDLLVKKANSLRIEVKSSNPDNPSPSGDPWFDDPQNLKIVNEAVAEYKSGKSKGKEYSIEEIQKLLGL
jgi:hypothetical protein